MLRTKIANREVITKEVDITEMLEGFLNLVSLARQDSFHILGSSPGLEHTQPGDDLCAFVSEGISLQSLDSTVNATHQAPVLTSRIVGSMVLVEGAHISSLVTKSVFTTILHTLRMEDHSSLSGSPSLVFIQDTSRRIITNFDKSLENICHVQNDVLNLGHVLERLMSELETEYKRLLMVNIPPGIFEIF